MQCNLLAEYASWWLTVWSDALISHMKLFISLQWNERYGLSNRRPDHQSNRRLFFSKAYWGVPHRKYQSHITDPLWCESTNYPLISLPNGHSRGKGFHVIMSSYDPCLPNITAAFSNPVFTSHSTMFSGNILVWIIQVKIYFFVYNDSKGEFFVNLSGFICYAT